MIDIYRNLHNEYIKVSYIWDTYYLRSRIVTLTIRQGHLKRKQKLFYDLGCDNQGDA